MNKYSKTPVGTSKTDRQQALLNLIRKTSISTQGELVKHLQTAGFSCTQVSVSRDIRELGLVKKGGRYTAPEDPTSSAASMSDDIADLTDNIAVFMRDISVVGDNLIVVKTLPGTAHSVGLLLDNVSWPDIAGTVAGDDTVFIAGHGGRIGCEAIAKRLTEMSGKGK